MGARILNSIGEMIPQGVMLGVALGLIVWPLLGFRSSGSMGRSVLGAVIGALLALLLNSVNLIRIFTGNAGPLVDMNVNAFLNVTQVVVRLLLVGAAAGSGIVLMFTDPGAAGQGIIVGALEGLAVAAIAGLIVELIPQQYHSFLVLLAMGLVIIALFPLVATQMDERSRRH